MTGVQIPLLRPGSEEWLRCMSSSKVAAVLGLSPYESRFSLWHRMTGAIPAQADSDVLRRGHYLEPGIASWFADQHPELAQGLGGTWRHGERTWQVASPDRLLFDDAEAITPVAILEVKTAADDSDWGKPGTDDIPIGYRAQVMWQMDVVGVPVTHVAVLSAFLEFREYVVTYDPDEADDIRSRCEAFMATLPGGPNETRPNLDEHTATYQAVRALNPDIDGNDVELPLELADRYCVAVAAFKEVEAKKTAASSAVMDYLGAAKRATWGKRALASRRAVRDGLPFLVPGRNLPPSIKELG
nr:YqaJ viral recombinase family protein [Enterococcus hirae]